MALYKYRLCVEYKISPLWCRDVVTGDYNNQRGSYSEVWRKVISLDGYQRQGYEGGSEAGQGVQESEGYHSRIHSFLQHSCQTYWREVSIGYTWRSWLFWLCQKDGYYYRIFECMGINLEWFVWFWMELIKLDLCQIESKRNGRWTYAYFELLNNYL